MVKKIGAAAIFVWMMVLGIALWQRSRPQDITKDVLGETVIPIQEIPTQTTTPSTPTMKPTATATPEPTKGPYPMEIDTKKMYEAILKTDLGDITVSLTASATPITVNNFVVLSKKLFYDNTIFHRVIDGFMIQGGDPKGNGTGGPGYVFNDEPFTGEYTRGTLAMANAGPNTNGSQFFIMHQNNALPKNYVIFGKVISGMDVVDKIATAPTKQEGERSTPIKPVVVKAIEIIEK